MADNSKFRKLYVGNLDMSVTEELLVALFGQLGSVKGCKIIHEPGTDPYAFIEFADHQAAAAALLAMNKRLCLGKEMKVNWATSTGYIMDPKPSDGGRATQGNYHIFVGDLAPEIESQQLRDAFAPFGDISDVKIMRFPDTHKPKGYGFVSFANRTDAENAISSMNSQWLGTRKIRTNWATRKVQPGQDNQKLRESSRRLNYEEVWQWTSDTNTSVYCGGILDAASSDNPSSAEEMLRSVFEKYGTIVEVRAFREKGFGFIKFATKEAACAAICGVHGSDINGSVAKCGWGRDDGSHSSAGGGTFGSQSTNMGHLNQIAAATALFNAATAAAAAGYGSPDCPTGMPTGPNNPYMHQMGNAAGYPMAAAYNMTADGYTDPSYAFQPQMHDAENQWSNWWNEYHNALNANSVQQQQQQMMSAAAAVPNANCYPPKQQSSMVPSQWPADMSQWQQMAAAQQQGVNIPSQANFSNQASMKPADNAPYVSSNPYGSVNRFSADPNNYGNSGAASANSSNTIATPVGQMHAEQLRLANPGVNWGDVKPPSNTAQYQQQQQQ